MKWFESKVSYLYCNISHVQIFIAKNILGAMKFDWNQQKSWRWLATFFKNVGGERVNHITSGNKQIWRTSNPYYKSYSNGTEWPSHSTTVSLDTNFPRTKKRKWDQQRDRKLLLYSMQKQRIFLQLIMHWNPFQAPSEMKV